MLRAAGRQIAKRHKKAQRPHGRQSVKKLMAHGENVNSIEVEAPKLFDRMARRFNKEPPKTQERTKEVVREER